MTRSNRPFNFHNLLSSAHICVTELSYKDCDEIIRIVNHQKSRIIASRMEQVTREIKVMEKEVARRELNERPVNTSFSTREDVARRELNE